MAAAVQYGRRRGTPKAQDFGLNPRISTKIPSQAALLSTNDWHRIKQNLSGVNLEKQASDQRKAEKDAKHEKSRSIVKHWDNTIEGQRLKRLAARKTKEDREEEERLKVDEEEAKFQATQRKEAIDKAKTLLYYSTDRVKDFHKGLVLSEVLREREKQIEKKKEKEELYKNQDAGHLKWQAEQRERARLADIEAAAIRAKEMKDLTEYQMSQISKHNYEKTQLRKAQLEEQAAIEEETRRWQEKEHERAEKRYQDKLQFRKELDDNLKCNRELEEKRKLQELAEEGERKIFSDAKRNMVKMRKAKEKEILKEFHDHQDRICGKLAKFFEEKVSDEDSKIAKAVAEREAKREKEQKEKQEKFADSMKEIFKHRAEMLQEQREKQKQMKEFDENMLRQRIAHDEKFHAAALEKAKKKHAEAKDLQEYLKTQAIEGYKRDIQELNEERDHFYKNLELVDVEEDQFQQYAAKVIQEAKARDGNLYPLWHVARKGAGGGKGPAHPNGVCPSFKATDSTFVELPSYKSKVLPVSWRPANTKKRMGFIW